ncbi:MAG TPA: SDR family NAD(P)-dependent oxidoreductase [Anaerolineae bacterium]|nr:SDR family NAD(P)-dependent oxidoreductase [Anaerolineae bacterium]HID83811.1 SDR family NAD(P)-dependent oxidoreductase [Anaerolineales bacterium]HIQ09670.1 SDR family NAD(P)-dependent oxidoreductase [Anaerolineaceae bacterium]
MGTPPVLLLTGASRGLGRGIALAAAELGAQLVLNARSEEKLQAVAAEAHQRGVNVQIVPGDIGQPETARRMVEAAQRHYGRIDAVVHNAGVLAPLAPVAQADLEAWQANWAVNFFGAVSLARAALPLLREAQGRLVLISSGAAVHPYPTWGAYCTAKAALNHLAAVLAVEEPQVTTLAFRPGVVDTDMQTFIREQGQRVMPPELHQRFVGYKTQGRLHDPEGVGRTVAHIALAAPREWSGRFIAFYEEPARSWLQARSVAVA